MNEFVLVLFGNTFPYREELKRRGFMWHASDKVWTIQLHPPAEIVKNHDLKKWVRSLVGVSSTEELGAKFGYGRAANHHVRDLPSRKD